MGFSIHVDWGDERSFDRWVNHGRRVMQKFYENNSKEVEKEGYEVEDGEIKYLDEILDHFSPMMNFAYPLETIPDDDKIRKVCQETCLTVMEDTEDEGRGSYYLALCGGGMDLSQSIAYAYMIAETWIPMELLGGVCTQPNFSIHGTKWLKLARQIRRQEMMEIKRFLNSRKEWSRQIKVYEKERKERRKLKEA